MKNKNIVEQLIDKYGLEKTITFCEMNILVYTEMCKELSSPLFDDDELAIEYDYQIFKWTKILNDLTPE
jgi:hypothetical protein